MKNANSACAHLRREIRSKLWLVTINIVSIQFASITGLKLVKQTIILRKDVLFAEQIYLKQELSRMYSRVILLTKVKRKKALLLNLKKSKWAWSWVKSKSKLLRLRLTTR